MHNMPVSRAAVVVELMATYFMDLVASIHFLWLPVMVWAELQHQIPHMLQG